MLTTRERNTLERVAALLWQAQEVVDTEAPTYSTRFDRLDQQLTELAREVDGQLSRDAQQRSFSQER